MIPDSKYPKYLSPICNLSLINSFAIDANLGFPFCDEELEMVCNGLCCCTIEFSSFYLFKGKEVVLKMVMLSQELSSRF